MAGPRPIGITILAVLETLGVLLDLSVGVILVSLAPVIGGSTLLLGLLAWRSGTVS